MYMYVCVYVCVCVCVIVRVCLRVYVHRPNTFMGRGVQT